MAGNGNDPRLDPRNQAAAPPPPEFIQKATNHPAKEPAQALPDVATRVEEAAQMAEEIAHYAAEYARDLRISGQRFANAVQQMLKIAR